MARCASGRSKWVAIIPLVIPSPQFHCDQTVLVNLFHERTEDTQVETTSVREGLATGTLPAQLSNQYTPEVVPLTARELEVLSLMGLALRTPEIAGELTISINTARNHVRNVCEKLRARSKLEAIIIAQRRGLL